MLVLYCCRNYHLMSLLLLIVFTLALAFAEKLSRSFYKEIERGYTSVDFGVALRLSCLSLFHSLLKGRASTGNTMNVTSEHWTRANKLREANLAKLTRQPVFFLKSYALLMGLKKLEKLNLRVLIPPFARD